MQIGCHLLAFHGISLDDCGNWVMPAPDLHPQASPKWRCIVKKEKPFQTPPGDVLRDLPRLMMQHYIITLISGGTFDWCAVKMLWIKRQITAVPYPFKGFSRTPQYSWRVKCRRIRAPMSQPSKLDGLPNDEGPVSLFTWQGQHTLKYILNQI